MEDVIQVQDQFYILATVSKATERTAVLKNGDTFAVFDYSGDVAAFGAGPQGLYHEGTRYLSRFRLRLNGHNPLLLSSRVKDDNDLFGADLTNPDIPLDEEHVLAHDLVHLFRARFLWEGTWHERIRLWNYSRGPVHVSLTFDIDADFADIFEVRGAARAERGLRLPPMVRDAAMRLGYRGLDGEDRWTVFEWSEPPKTATPGVVRFEYDLAPHSPATLSVAIRCERQHRPVTPIAYEIAESASAAANQQTRAEYAMVETSSERFNQWIRRSMADLRMLVSDTPYGPYPYAGVPWFSTPFGRNGILSACKLVWNSTRITRAGLEYLSATQAERFEEANDAEPGKILHDTRSSEMARLREVPFGQYYGSVDSTSLFVILAGASY